MTRKLKRTSKYVNLLGAKLNAGSNALISSAGFQGDRELRR